MGLPRDAWVGTAGANLGYVLGGKYLFWEPPTPSSVVLEAIDKALDRLRPLASLEDLEQLWEIVGQDDPWWRLRQIVALLLIDRRDGIPALLETARGEFCREDDEVCDQFRAFRERLQEAMVP